LEKFHTKDILNLEKKTVAFTANNYSQLKAFLTCIQSYITTIPPTQIVQVDEPFSFAAKTIHDKQLKHRCLKGFNIKPDPDYLKSRKPVLVNEDCKISLAAPTQSMNSYFFKNADADEVVFIHQGNGILKSIYGQIRFSYGDYLVIPRGTNFISMAQIIAS